MPRPSHEARPDRRQYRRPPPFRPPCPCTSTGRFECPENDSYWSAAAGITYMGVDSASTRAEQAFLRVIDIARHTGFRGGLYPHAIARLADIYLHQGKYEQSIALCRQAIASTPSDKPDEQGQYIAAENLTEAYRRLGLYDEACATAPS